LLGQEKPHWDVYSRQTWRGGKQTYNGARISPLGRAGVSNRFSGWKSAYPPPPKGDEKLGINDVMCYKGYDLESMARKIGLIPI